MYPQQFQQLLLADIKKRLLDENIPRLKKCLAQLSESEIWHRPNPNTNTVGNLVLHLCGNVRQWLIAGLGQAADTRQRQQEFDETGPMATAILLEKLDSLAADIEKTLNQISVEDLLQEQTVQGIYQETGISILVHVTEHFSYHVGQVTYFVKLTKDMDMGYYAGLNLNG